MNQLPLNHVLTIVFQDVDQSSEEYKFIAEKIKLNPVIMFTKSTCKFCKMAKEVMDGIGVKYAEEDIGEKENCQAIQDVFKQLTGERTVRNNLMFRCFFFLSHFNSQRCVLKEPEGNGKHSHSLFRVIDCDF